MDKQKWFAIFGEGAPWIQVLLNTILGVLFAFGIVVFTFKFITTSIQAKTTDDVEVKQQVRKTNVKNVIAIAILFGIATLTFTLVNIMPAPSKPNTSSFFDVFKGASADAQKYFNIAITILISIAIVVFLILTPIKLIKYIGADEEDKVKLRKSLVSSAIWLVGIILTLFIVNVVLNVVPSPKTI